MYLRHFGFDQAPFSITPDHRFVYLSPQHQESLAHLIYGISRGGGAGFVLLTGEVGTGKTTLSRLLLEQQDTATGTESTFETGADAPAQRSGEKIKIALILNPRLTPVELLESILRELGIPLRGVTGQLNRMVNRLNDYLLKAWAEGQNTVVMIDEAQNLPPETLEQLRLLTNLETDKHKLLQVILIGQPELRETLRRNDLRQLAQRITARYHLRELNRDDSAAYLAHRCRIAGAEKSPFSPAACKAIYRYSGGVPRLINTLADRALLVAWNRERKQVTGTDVRQAASEVLDSPASSSRRINSTRALLIVAALAGIAALTYRTFSSRPAVYFDTPAGPEPATQPQRTVSGPAPERDAAITSGTQTAAHAGLGNGHNSPPPDFDWPDTLQAWRQYAALWGSHAGGWDKYRCPAPESTGMACLRRQGNLAQIRRLNRPVLLQTSQPQKLVLLETIGNDGQIWLRNRHEQAVAVARPWLEQHWLGTYYVLWPMPAELLRVSLPAPQSAAVTEWARRLAQKISGESLSDKTALRDWLKAFQANHGLLADGIIGPETAMALSLKAYTGPSLSQKTTTPDSAREP